MRAVLALAVSAGVASILASIPPRTPLTHGRRMTLRGRQPGRRKAIDIPTCTADEDLEYVQPILVCVPVDCAEKYGNHTYTFDSDTRLCAQRELVPSPTPAPAANSTGFTCTDPNATPHCGTLCTCQCQNGWTANTTAIVPVGQVVCVDGIEDAGSSCSGTKCWLIHIDKVGIAGVLLTIIVVACCCVCCRKFPCLRRLCCCCCKKKRSKSARKRRRRRRRKRRRKASNSSSEDSSSSSSESEDGAAPKTPGGSREAVVRTSPLAAQWASRGLPTPSHQEAKATAGMPPPLPPQRRSVSSLPRRLMELLTAAMGTQATTQERPQPTNT